MDRPPHARSASATFSLRSDKSHTSKGSKTKKEPLVETQEEKRKRELVSKANPNAAMNEAQPVAEALKAPTIGSLRDVQHVDTYGNAIAEPDLSNPTRPRWERPLDTIRSFEAAIENDYKRRSPGTRPGTSMFSDSGVGYGSRRGSYFGGDQYQGQPRYSQGGSQVGSNYGGGGGGGGGGYYGRNSFMDSYGGNGQDNRYAPGPSAQRRPYDRRQHSEPMLNRHNNAGGVYPSPGYQRSRDTVNTGDSHSQSEPWTNNTDPSSENSSIDQIRMATKYDQSEQHGYNGGSFQQRPIREETQMGSDLSRPPPVYDQQSQQQQQSIPPPPPPHQYNRNGPAPARQGNRLMKLNSGGNASHGGPPPVPGKDNSYAPSRPQLQTGPSQKRQSWLKRTFSKKT